MQRAKSQATSNRNDTHWVWLLPGVIVLVLLVEGRSLASASHRNLGNLSLESALVSGQSNAGALTLAETSLEQATALHPETVAAYRSLGEVRILNNDYAGASVAFLVSRADPHIGALQLVWLELAGERNLHLQRYEEALKVRDVMAGLTAGYRGLAEFSCESKTVETAQGRAWRLWLEGEGRAEEIAYQLVIELAPSCPGAYYRLGGLYYGQQRYDEAENAYQQGILADSKTVACGYGYLAGTYMEQGRLDEVVRAAEAASQHGGGPQAHMLLGRVYQLKGDLSLAQGYYSTAASQVSQCDQDDWSRWAAYFYMGWMAFDRKEYDLALSHMRQASQVMPGTSAEPQALKYVGDMYMQRGMLPEAILEYERAIALAPAGWDWVWSVHLALADAYRGSGQVDAAIREYTEVLRLKPDYQYARTQIYQLEAGQ